MPVRADALARRLAEKHGSHDPFALCRALGIVVTRHPLSDVRGYCMRHQGVQIITLASDLTRHPARFVCAHELGHCFMHGGLNRVFMDSRTFMWPDKFETECDRFACHLLFGRPPLFQEESLSNRQMAACLNVPLAQVNARLIELGIYM